jgi:hypothetical protein
MNKHVATLYVEPQPSLMTHVPCGMHGALIIALSLDKSFQHRFIWVAALHSGEQTFEVHTRRWRAHCLTDILANPEPKQSLKISAIPWFVTNSTLCTPKTCRVSQVFHNMQPPQSPNLHSLNECLHHTLCTNVVPHLRFLWHAVWTAADSAFSSCGRA